MWKKLLPSQTRTHTHTHTHSREISPLLGYYAVYSGNFFKHLPAHENETVFSETSAYKLQTPGNNPEESIHFLTDLLTYSMEQSPSLEANRFYS